MMEQRSAFPLVSQKAQEQGVTRERLFKSFALVRYPCSRVSQQSFTKTLAIALCLIALSSCQPDSPPDPCRPTYVFRNGLHIRQFRDIACEEGDIDKAIKQIALQYERKIMDEALLVNRKELVDAAEMARGELDPTFKRVDGKKQRKLNRLTQELRQHSQRTDVKYQTVLVRHLKEPGLSNAWVIADGTIYITEALYDTFAGQEDVIAFILAHEIAHIENLAIDKKIALGKVVKKRFGEGWLANFAKEQIQGLTKALGQYDELIADRSALYLMHEAGYNPRAALAFFHYLEDNSKAPAAFKTVEMLSRTHPYNHSRFNCLNHYLYESQRLPAGCY